MGNLEHNIKEAFANRDAKTKFANKDAMWSRLNNQMRQGKGVAALWRVAAILFGVLFLTGAFAAISSRAKQNDKLERLELDNRELSAAIDSLLTLPLNTQPEIQIIEREKIVYRDRIVTQQNSNSEKYWEKKYRDLSDSTQLILANNEKSYKDKVEQLSAELSTLQDEFTTYQKDFDKSEEEKQGAPFELKSERIDVGVSNKPAVKNPEMEMKVFQRNFIENRNNLNRTIFKK